ncbi:TIGR03862 family flavoprotein [Niveibacterium sp. SC-1]|uniref:TIGR03862 family flavoprotein n=1 Tax=Niveibacterium sp. SC-1 TaxID=3135646 RepID=UPI00311DF6DE
MSSRAPASSIDVAVIGAGPAGLMAAERLAAAGRAVQVFEAMPSMARKFLMAGKGGMNITHSEPFTDFLGRYGARATQLQPLLEAFGPEALRAWIHALGIETFVGSSGRVFPTEMKAAPLLRAWVARLRERGVRFQVRHRWQGWDEDDALRFAHGDETVRVRARATVLALGGGSWARLGSDGAWQPWLAARGVALAPLAPANCGFDIAWSAHFRERFAGEALKNVGLLWQDANGRTQRRIGECMITAEGIEGGLIYAFSAGLRETIAREGRATLRLDLLPEREADKVREAVAHPRGSRSLASHLQSRLNLKGVKAALLREALDVEGMNDPVRLAATIKSLPLQLVSPRPIDEAISTAGGVRFDALDEHLMLRALPGVFCAGEMLDWEAPTGGYLLTACFATGRAAGDEAARWLRQVDTAAAG